jgi:hypothetical protein
LVPEFGPALGAFVAHCQSIRWCLHDLVLDQHVLQQENCPLMVDSRAIVFLGKLERRKSLGVDRLSPSFFPPLPSSVRADTMHSACVAALTVLARETNPTTRVSATPGWPWSHSFCPTGTACSLLLHGRKQEAERSCV